jgi:hypothetical protein
VFTFIAEFLGKTDDGIPVTYPIDPTGGHLSTGVSKTPLKIMQKHEIWSQGTTGDANTHPRTASKRSGIVMDIRVGTLCLLESDGVAGGGESLCPIPNGLPVTVAVDSRYISKLFITCIKTCSWHDEPKREYIRGAETRLLI